MIACASGSSCCRAGQSLDLRLRAGQQLPTHSSRLTASSKKARKLRRPVNGMQSRDVVVRSRNASAAAELDHAVVAWLLAAVAEIKTPQAVEENDSTCVFSAFESRTNICWARSATSTQRSLSPLKLLLRHTTASKLLFTLASLVAQAPRSAETL